VVRKFFYLESFRALKFSDLESFRRRKFSDLEKILDSGLKCRALKLDNLVKGSIYIMPI
jgi:hypothetical protein